MEKPLDLADRLIAEEIASRISRVVPTVRRVRQAFAFTITVPTQSGEVQAECAMIDGHITPIAFELRRRPEYGGNIVWSTPRTHSEASAATEVRRYCEIHLPEIRLAIDAANHQTVTDWLERYDDGTNHDSLDADFRDGRDE